MKKGIVFFWGFLTGCVLTVGVLFIIVFLSSAPNIHTDQPESTHVIPRADIQIPFTASKKFEVFQVLDDGVLAKSEEHKYSGSMFTGPTVYIPSDGQNMFYNDQVIEIPNGKVAMQTGTYRYNTRHNEEKVVPVIEFI